MAEYNTQVDTVNITRSNMGSVNRFMKPMKANQTQTYVSQYVPQPFELMQRAVDKEQAEFDAIEKNYEQQQAAIINLSSHTGVDSEAMGRLQKRYQDELETAMDSRDLGQAESSVRGISKRMGVDYKTGQLGKLISSGLKEQAYTKGKEEARTKKIGDGGWAPELEGYLEDAHIKHQQEGIEMNPNVLTKVHRGTTDIRKIVHDISGDIKKSDISGRRIDQEGGDFHEYYTWIEGNTTGVTDARATAAIMGTVLNDPDAAEDLRIQAIMKNKGNVNAVDFERAIASGEISEEDWQNMYRKEVMHEIEPGVVAATFELSTRKRKIVANKAAGAAATDRSGATTISNTGVASSGNIIPVSALKGNITANDTATKANDDAHNKGEISDATYDATKTQLANDRAIYQGQLEERRTSYVGTTKGKAWIKGAYDSIMQRHPERFYKGEVLDQIKAQRNNPSKINTILKNNKPTLSLDQWEETFIKMDPRETSWTDGVMVSDKNYDADLGKLVGEFQSNTDEYQEANPIAYDANPMTNTGSSDKKRGAVGDMNLGLTREIEQQTDAYLMPNGQQLNTWIEEIGKDRMDDADIKEDNYRMEVSIMDNSIDGKPAYSIAFIDKKNGNKVTENIIPQDSESGWNNISDTGVRLMKENASGEGALVKSNYKKGNWMAANAHFRDHPNMAVKNQLYISKDREFAEKTSPPFRLPINGQQENVMFKRSKERGNNFYELVNEDGAPVILEDGKPPRFNSISDLKVYIYNNTVQ